MPTSYSGLPALGEHRRPYTFFPFGSGSRRCLGAAFANYQMKIVIAQILLRVELRKTEGYTAKATRRGIAFAPSEGLPVVALKCSSENGHGAGPLR